MQPLAHTHHTVEWEAQSEIKITKPVVWDKNSLKIEIK